MKKEVVDFKCSYPSEFLEILKVFKTYTVLQNYDLEPAARAVLEFLNDEGAELVDIEEGEIIPIQQYHVILPGKMFQIRISSILLDSIRDFIVLSVVLAHMKTKDDGVPMALAGAAIASFVRSSLTNIHKLDEYAGERCIAKTMMKWKKDNGLKTPIDKSKLFYELTHCECTFKKCKYRKVDSCSLKKLELDKLLSHLEQQGTIKRRGTSSFELIF